MIPYVSDPDFTLYCGDALEVLRELPDASVDCALTSPPFYALRDYGLEPSDWPEVEYETLGGRVRVPAMRCALGLEPTPEAWVGHLLLVFREVRRVLKDSGTFWVECGDSYNSGTVGRRNPTSTAAHGCWENGDLQERVNVTALKPKDLLGQPWLLAFALRGDGWYLRQCIVWAKPNAMPESVTDRCTTAHSYAFLLSKKPRYFFDAEAIAEPAEWARWGDQTTPKYGGTETASGWMQPKTKAELRGGRAALARRRSAVVDGGAVHEVHSTEPSASKNPRSVWTIPTQGFSARELGGGATRIASPDCPVHGDRAAPVPTAHDDGHAGSLSNRTQRSDGRPAQAQLDDSAPTAPHRAPDSAPGSSDSPRRERAPVASLHSSESHRTDPAPATSPACSADVETFSRIGDMSASHDPAAATRPDMPASRTSEACDEHEPDSDAAQTAPRTAGRCTCKSSIPDHFATWPEALVERILKACCPEWVCARCGRARERLTEASYEKSPKHGAGSTVRKRNEDTDTNGWAGEAMPRVAKVTETVGWSDCGCNAGFIPGVCLDPFMGSGTTALVARRLGRKSIGLELNADYCAMAARRLSQLSLLAEGAA